MDNKEEIRLDNSNFQRLSSEIGEDLAKFCFCAYLNIKCDTDIEVQSWRDYEETILKLEKNRFRDGVTDINEILQLGISNEDRWQLEWGEGDEKNPYSEKDYRRLDELYQTMSSRLKKSGGMDEQQEHIIRSCCRMSLLSEKSIAKGDKENIDIAAKLNKMIQDNLSSENLRKKDEKPVEVAKIHGIVEALNNKYGVGVELTHEQAVKICSEWLISHRYPMTVDAADQMLKAIINCTRTNNDEPEIERIPEEFGFANNCCEFAETSNGIELEAFNYLGIELGEE